MVIFTKFKLPAALFFLAMMTGSVFFEIGNYPYLLDMPSYLNDKYVVTKGIPKKVTMEEPPPRSMQITDTVTLTVNGQEFQFDVLPSTSLDDFKNKIITIYYLPHSEWVGKYSLDG